MKRPVKRLTRPLFIVVLAGLLLLLLVSSFKSYFTNLKRAEDRLLQELHALAITSSLLIDGDQHESLTDQYKNKDDIITIAEDPRYHLLHNALNRIATSNHLETPIYTLVPSDSGRFYEFVVSSSTTPYYRHTYAKFPEYLAENFENGGKIECYETSTGIWASAFAPIKNSRGDVVAVIQIDRNFETFQAAAGQEFVEDLILSVVIFGFTTVLLTLIVRRMTSRIDETQLALEKANLGLMREVEERKKAEQKLKENNEHIQQKAVENVVALEERFAKIYNHSNDGILILDPKEDRIIDGNPAACRLLEYSKEDLVNTKMSEVHPHEIIELNQFCDTILNQGSGWTDELSCFTKSGTYVPAEISASIFSDGSTEYMVAMVRDVSSRVQARRELEEMNQKLEQRVAERTKELTKANLELKRTLRELKKANSELDHFLYKVTHDFRAPLLSILGLINLVKKEPLQNEDHLNNYLDLIEGSVKKLDDLNVEITCLMKSQRTGVNIRQIDLHKTIHEESNSLDFLFQQRRINWKINIDEQIPFYSDAFRIKMIIHNILYNAVKYGDKEKKKCIVEVKASVSQEECRLEVKDNGIGIPAELKDKIFEMFFRGTEYSTGSGLGLYIVNETIQKLEGGIHVDSAAGIGTTFSIVIPNLNEKVTQLQEEKLIQT